VDHQELWYGSKNKIFYPFRKNDKTGMESHGSFLFPFHPCQAHRAKKKVAQKNIELVFPEKTDAEKRKMLDGSYRT
jgi:hypothetical protein